MDLPTFLPALPTYIHYTALLDFTIPHYLYIPLHLSFCGRNHVSLRTLTSGPGDEALPLCELLTRLMSRRPVVPPSSSYQDRNSSTAAQPCLSTNDDSLDCGLATLQPASSSRSVQRPRLRSVLDSMRTRMSPPGRTRTTSHRQEEEEEMASVPSLIAQAYRPAQMARRGLIAGGKSEATLSRARSHFGS